jgi:hypothetical protein
VDAREKAWGAVHVRAGHVEARVVYTFLGPALRFWWSLLEDENRRLRDLGNDATISVHFDWLAGVFDRLAADGGRPSSIDRADTTGELPEMIAAYEDAILIAEESRMVPERRLSPRRRSALPVAGAEPPTG